MKKKAQKRKGSTKVSVEGQKQVQVGGQEQGKSQSRGDPTLGAMYEFFEPSSR